MGMYSWEYCDSDGRMICGKRKDSYLLVPKEFGGGHIVEHCYQGYGKMGGVDVFEQIAEWNRKYLDPDEIIKTPKRSNWYDTIEGQISFERAMERYAEDCKMIQDFAEGKSEPYMVSMYGAEYKREIGIMISDDEVVIKYPIKIAEKADSVYEDCKRSWDDLYQGCL